MRCKKMQTGDLLMPDDLLRAKHILYKMSDCAYLGGQEDEFPEDVFPEDSFPPLIRLCQMLMCKMTIISPLCHPHLHEQALLLIKKKLLLEALLTLMNDVLPR